MFFIIQGVPKVTIHWETVDKCTFLFTNYTLQNFTKYSPHVGHHFLYTKVFSLTHGKQFLCYLLCNYIHVRYIMFVNFLYVWRLLVHPVINKGTVCFGGGVARVK